MIARFATPFAMALALTGCAATEGLFKKDEQILPGTRISVRQAAPSNEAVSTAARQTIALPAALQNSDWPQQNGNAARSMGHVAASGSYAPVWQAKAGSTPNGRVFASPVVSAGTVYTMDGGATISAFNAASGALLWQVDLTPAGENSADGFGGGLAVDGGTLYVSSGFGRLFALSTTAGELRWSGAMRAPSRAAPLVVAGKVFAISRDNRIHAFDAASGEALWTGSGLEEVAGVLGGASPASNGEVVVAPFSSGELVAFLASTGRQIWDQEVRSLRGLTVLQDVAGDPVIAGDTVYAASQSGRLAAYALRDGELLWARDLSGFGSAYIVGDALFFVSDKATVYALDRASGATLWDTGLAALDTRDSPVVHSAPVVAGGGVLIAGSNGILTVLDASTGAVQREIALPDGASTAPVVAGGTAYILTDGADLIALR